MTANLVELAPGKKLKILREIDIFHPWTSLDEHRYCNRCGQTFTGRQIKVYRRRRGGARYRLECPTDGCPSVPIEWMAVGPQITPPTEAWPWFAG